MGRHRSVSISPPKSPHNGRARVWHPTRASWIDCGPWGSPEAELKFRRIAAEYLANPFAGYAPAKSVALSELLAGYLDHLDRTGASFNVTDEARRAAESLSEQYGTLPVGDFGPVQLTTWCGSLADVLSRATIRKFARSSIRAFEWGVTAEVIKTAETRLPDLERCDALIHCSKAAKPKKRKPAPANHVAAILGELTPTLAAAVRVQWLTGMRSGELLAMRPADITKSGRLTLSSGQVIDVDRETNEARARGEIGAKESVWLYVPGSHKTEHHGQFRVIPLVPAVQAIIDPFMARPPEAYLFCPRESMAAFRARQRSERKTRVQPSQANRAKAKPQKGPGDQYGQRQYAQAVERAIKRASAKEVAAGRPPIPAWTPHQLRHSAGAAVADVEGNIRGSQALLGHASPRTTEGYSRLSFRGAVSAASKLVAEHGNPIGA